MKVLKTLGLAESHRDRFATFPNGAAAMRAMAAAGDVRAVGVTQCSEILYTEGVQLVGALPGEFELATVYAAAITTKATADGRRDATRLLTALANADNAATRSGAGFEAIDW
jgi:molybdate transport system substrate-binding protein